MAVADTNAVPLTAMLVAPDRSLARSFTQAARGSGAFRVVGELCSYPPRQVFEIRLRQLQPQVALVDLATDLDRGAECVEAAAGKGVAVVGLHTSNHSGAILRSVRAGASEFLCEPFEPESQRGARDRIAQRIRPAAVGREPGTVTVFTPAKPGSGTSTLALHTAFAAGARGERVLLADFDFVDATATFCAGLQPKRSVLSLICSGGTVDHWPALAAQVRGIDVLGMPDFPGPEPVEAPRLTEFLEHARRLYDLVVLDLPVVFHRLSLLSLAQADLAFIVSTPDLAGLHLARKAVALLVGLGFEAGLYRVLVNREDGTHGLSRADMARIVNSPVNGFFPEDYYAVEQAVSGPEPLAAASALARSIDAFSREIAGRARRKAG